MTDRRILMFVKLPLPGQVKTRLAAELGAPAAVALYDAMVHDQLQAMEPWRKELVLCHAPTAPLDAYRDWLGRDRSFQLQEGEDLGERMTHAFEAAFAKGAEQAILMGSDLPEISAELAGEAFTALERNGATLAPSDDGGYTLIGFSRESFRPEVFDGIAWSTPRVLAATREAFARAGQHVHLLPPLADIDTATDLTALQRRHPTGGPRRTLALAAELARD